MCQTGMVVSLRGRANTSVHRARPGHLLKVHSGSIALHNRDKNPVWAVHMPIYGAGLRLPDALLLEYAGAILPPELHHV